MSDEDLVGVLYSIVYRSLTGDTEDASGALGALVQLTEMARRWQAVVDSATSANVSTEADVSDLPLFPRARSTDRASRTALEETFDRFDRESPNVWRLFKSFTFQAINAGHKHYSADAIVHRIRWHTSVETRGDDFKINSNHVAYYARKFAELFPEHAAFFRMRCVKGERAA